MSAPLFEDKKKRRKSLTAIARAVTRTRGREHRRKRTVLPKAEKQSRYNRQPATAKYVGTENSVFRTEYQQSNQNPKGRVPR